MKETLIVDMFNILKLYDIGHVKHRLPQFVFALLSVIWEKGVEHKEIENAPITSHFAVFINELAAHVRHISRCPHSARVLPPQVIITRLHSLMCDRALTLRLPAANIWLRKQNLSIFQTLERRKWPEIFLSAYACLQTPRCSSLEARAALRFLCLPSDLNPHAHPSIIRTCGAKSCTSFYQMFVSAIYSHYVRLCGEVLATLSWSISFQM